MLKRAFDIFFSLTGLIILSPVFVIISLIIIVDSRGGAFYIQKRVGRNNKDFNLFKFRTMHKYADREGLLTIGGKDRRITRSGYLLRKYKLDELPQLLNVLLSCMSFVGPRPELRKYVELYNDEQKDVLAVRPGITDVASIEYFNENDILGKSENPEQTYIQDIMPAKLKLNIDYIAQRNFAKDIRVIFLTIGRMLK